MFYVKILVQQFKIRIDYFAKDAKYFLSHVIKKMHKIIMLMNVKSKIIRISAITSSL